MKFLATLLMAAVCGMVVSADGYAAVNYTMSVSTGVVTIATGGNSYSWRGSSDDGRTGPVNIFPGGEPFTYCGTVFTQMQISTNGFIRFTSGGADTLTSSLASNSPGGTARKIVAPFWDDLSVVDSVANISYAVTGTSPNQIVAISWRNTLWPYNGNGAAAFQMKLYETSNIIEFEYDAFTVPTTGATARGASIALVDNTPIQSSNQATGTFMSLNVGGTPGSRKYHRTMGLAYTSVLTPPDNGTTLRFTPTTLFPLSGAYTVNNQMTGVTGADFPNLSAAAMALNIHGISGPVTLNVVSGTHDDVFHLIDVAGTSPTNTITVQQSGGTAIISPRNGNIKTSAPSTTTGDAIIRLDGTDYVTIQNLTLNNSNASDDTTKADMGILLGNAIQNRAIGDTARSGARFNIIKNLTMDMMGSPTSTGMTGIRFGTNGLAFDTSLTNSYNTVQDVDIRGIFRAAIRFFGYSGAFPDVGNKITAVSGRNTLGYSTGASGSDMRVIDVEGAEKDITIEKTDILNVTNSALTTNHIYGIVYNLAGSTTNFNSGNLIIRDCTFSNLSSTNAAHTGNVTAIQMSRTGDNAVMDVYNNKVYNLSSTTTSTGTVRGIVIAPSAALNTTANVFNNMVSDLKNPASSSTTTSVNVRGIEINQMTTANVFFNSVYLDNTSPVTGATQQSACLYGANLGSSTLSVKNNLFINLQGVGAGASRACAVYFTASTNADKMKTAASDYNVVYAGTPGAQNLLSYDVTNSTQTLVDYQTRYSPGEANARSKAVDFLSATDLHLTGASLGDADLAGAPIGTVLTDIDGQTRDTQAPYRGADEATPALPIQLAYLTATFDNSSRSVVIRWGTISEINNYGFEVMKRPGETGSFVTIPNSFIAGHGTTNEPQTYAFTDNNVTAGQSYYRLKQMDLDGSVYYTDPVQVSILTSVEDNLPTVFSLAQNYPNPFNPETKIRYELPEASLVKLTVYTVTGQEITSLVDQEQAAGRYEAIWKGTSRSGTKVASGVYFYRITAQPVNGGSPFSVLKKMVMLK